jgi:hypothetical protein
MKTFIVLVLLKVILMANDSNNTQTNITMINITDALINANFTNACSSVVPNKTEDCIMYSDDTTLCCLLESVNTPLQYRICNSLPRNETTPLKRVSNMLYKINCTGIQDYEKYFPFEGRYTACGIQSPKNESDCALYSNDMACCLASTTKEFDKNPMCYEYGNQNGNFQKDNFYFRCSSDYSKFTFFILFSLLVVLI